MPFGFLKILAPPQSRWKGGPVFGRRGRQILVSLGTAPLILTACLISMSHVERDDHHCIKGKENINIMAVYSRCICQEWHNKMSKMSLVEWASEHSLECLLFGRFLILFPFDRMQEEVMC